MTVTHDNTLISRDGDKLLPRWRSVVTFRLGDPFESRYRKSECDNGAVSVAADKDLLRKRDGSAGRHAQITLTWTSTVLQYPIGT